MSNLTCENIDRITNGIRELRKHWDNRLTFPLADLGERYLRGDLSILLDCASHYGKLGGRRSFSLRVLRQGINHPRIKYGSGGKCDIGATDDNDQFSVLIESVHIMNNAQRVADRVVSSLVWLQLPDEMRNISISDSLYFSVITGKFIFRGWGINQHRKPDGVLVIPPISDTGEIPGDMIQTRPQVMNDLSAQNSETNRNGEVSMIIHRFLPFLRIWIGNDWVFAGSKEAVDLSIEIADILIGPF